LVHRLGGFYAAGGGVTLSYVVDQPLGNGCFEGHAGIKCLGRCEGIGTTAAFSDAQKNRSGIPGSFSIMPMCRV
jgi:hypothetical protein